MIDLNSSRISFKYSLLLSAVIVLILSTMLIWATEAQAYNYDNEELQFLVLINNYRASNGLPRLNMSNPLYVASENHSYDMGINNYFSHNSQDGRTPWDRIRAAGYGYNTWLGENIAAGYTSAETVFEAWRNSPGHNANMLNGNFNAIGIGLVHVQGSYYGWYWTTDFGGISDDTTTPNVAITSPANGSTVGGTATVAANATDNVAVARVDFYVDGAWVAGDTTAPYSFSWDTNSYASGAHSITAVATDTAGLTSQSVITLYANDNVPPVVSIPNPTGSSMVSGNVVYYADAWDNVAVAQVDLYIDGDLVASRTSPPYSYNWRTTDYAQGNHTLLSVARDTIGLTSQATINVSVDNFTPSDQYYFTWYDQSSSDWKDWVLIANPVVGQVAARTSVQIDQTTYADRNLAVGAPAETPSFPGIIGGPAIVKATEPLITSQRVVYKDSFNEIPGIHASRLESTYFFTWYDSLPENGMVGDWILVSNQGDAAANVEIYIGGNLKGAYSIPAGGQITPSYANTMDGPVKVTSTNGQPLIVSQRVLYNSSFTEVLGIPESKLSSEYSFTWYDSRPDNHMKGNWILIANQDRGDAYVDVYIGGNLMGSYVIPEGGRVTPQYPNLMAGPVKVVSTNGKLLMTSQRVLFKESFEEVQGMTTDDFATDLWFTWYDSLRANNMNGNWILVANEGTQVADVEVYIDSVLKTRLNIPVGGNVPLSYANTMGGPVRVVSTNGQPLVATQRVVYMNSFNEIGGMQY